MLKINNISVMKGEISFTIKAQKGGSVGFPTFNESDPYIESLVLPYIKNRNIDQRVFLYGKSYYQKMLLKLNKRIYGDDKGNYITFHEMRHSRLTFLGRVLKAMPEEIKSWTGSRTDSFSIYFAARRVERFKGKIR